MGPGSTLINISARPSIWRHGVSVFGTSTLVTAWDVHTLVGTKMADALGALVNVIAGVSVLPEVKALCAVALV